MTDETQYRRSSCLEIALSRKAFNILFSTCCASLNVKTTMISFSDLDEYARTHHEIEEYYSFLDQPEFHSGRFQSLVLGSRDVSCDILISVLDCFEDTLLSTADRTAFGPSLPGLGLLSLSPRQPLRLRAQSLLLKIARLSNPQFWAWARAPPSSDLDGLLYLRLFDLVNWLRGPALRITFPTEILSLSVEQAQALFVACNRWSGGTSETYGSALAFFQRLDKSSAAGDAQLCAADIAALSDLHRSLTDLLRTRFSDSGAFVRLSTRSPKDAIALTPRYRDAVAAAAASADTTDHALASRAAFIEGGRVETAAEALALLACSQRVRDDLAAALRELAVFEMELLVREFHRIDPASELRVVRTLFRFFSLRLWPLIVFVQFISQGEVTAISQYYTHCVFPAQLTHRAAMERALLEFVRSSVVPALPFESCVLDAVVPALANVTAADCAIIEVNPFSRATDACLFSWVQDSDRLHHGPVEFRVKDHE